MRLNNCVLNTPKWIQTAGNLRENAYKHREAAKPADAANAGLENKGKIRQIHPNTKILGKCRMIKQIAAALIALGGLAACVPEETSTTTTNAKPAAACTAEQQASLMAAADVLSQRGFHNYNAERVMVRSATALGCPWDGPWTQKFAEGLVEGSGELIDVDYNIENGALLDFSDPVTLAKTLPECYRRGALHTVCKPNYHPMFGDPKLTDTSATVCWPNPELKANPDIRKQPGYQIHFPEEVCETPPAPRACKLSSNWKKFCRHREASYDGCWSFPKADIVTGPPPRNVKSRIDLARAKKVQESKVLVAAAKPQELPGTLCEPLHWWGPYIK